MADQTPRSIAISASPPLVGREREQAVLRDALAGAQAGRESLVLVGGVAGIGKTTLAEALLAEAAGQGALVLVGRCYDLSETPPYGPWRELFARAPRGDGLPVLPQALLPAEQGGEALASQEAVGGRAQTYLATLAARQPVVLLLDDLHWADPASLALLRVVARGLTDVPLLLLATYRADEVARGHLLDSLLPLLVREARAVRLDLRALTPGELHALVRPRYALAPDDEDRLAAYLGGRSEGNPLYAGEVLRALEEAGLLHQAADGWALGDLAAARVPGLLRQVIDGRVARLGDGARELLVAAAVIGQEVPLALWATVSGAAEGAIIAVAERAIAARLLAETPDGAGVRFAHALIREALYEGLGALRRPGWHRKAAEALMAQPAPDPDAVAYHFQRAGDPRAVEWLERAGERARQAYAWLTAADRYEAALALLAAGGGDAGRRGWLAYQLAELRGDAAARRALAHAEEALRLADAAGDLFLAALSTFRVGDLSCAPSIYDRRRGLPLMIAGLTALAALPEAARVPPGMAAPLDPALLWGPIILQLGWSGRYAEALVRGERYLAEMALPAMADWAGNTSRADVFHSLGHIYAGLGRPDRARDALARARELRQAAGHHLMAAAAAWDEALVAQWYAPDRPDELARLLAGVAEARGRGVGADAGLGERRGWEIPRLLREGRWAELREVARALVDSHEDNYLPELGRLDRMQGRPEPAWARVRRLLPAGPATEPGDPDLLFALPLHRLAADLALDAGDLPLASAWLEAHDRWLAWSGAVLGQAEGHLGWAAYHRAAGDLVAARKHAEQALARASEPRQPLALLAAHRALGELDTEAGRHAAATAHFDAALALADACAAPYERALTLLAVAELRAAEGRHEQTATALDEARILLTPLEARAALARADALADRLAVATPMLAVTTAALPFGLTAREAEVLRLLAEGLTDPQIAARLFVSRNTVNSHLRAVYGKLGVNTRAAAARIAFDQGLR